MSSISMIWLAYNLLFAFAFLLMLPKFLWRMRRRGGYARDFAQRIGIFRPEIRERLAEKGRIWIHAVSVGEIFVAIRLMSEFRKRRLDIRFVLSTTTSTGYAIGKARIKEPDVLIYFPVDFPAVTKRVFNLIHPSALILVESEFWPNVVRTAWSKGTPIFLVNGRISPKSFCGYRRLKVFTSRIFRLFTWLCVQSEEDKQRLLELGAPDDHIRVMNSIKYDVAELDSKGKSDAEAVLNAVAFTRDRLILLGGSTWSGEEEILLDIYSSLRLLWPELALVLAPRHVERKEEVLSEIKQRGLSVRVRSEISENGAPCHLAPDVLMIDTTGELKNFYPHATIIFIGKSLCANGGQNIIEPALHGKPVIVGPHMGNFPIVLEEFKEAGAICQVPNAISLESAIADLLGDEPSRMRMGGHAASLVRRKSGAVHETVALIEHRLFEKR